MSEAPPADGNARAAWVAALYDRHRGALVRYAVMLLTNTAEAEDVVQEIFAALLAAAPGVREPEVFLRTAVRNAAFSRLRRRRTVLAASGQFLEPVSADCTVEERVALERALRQLPVEQREVIHLHVYEGMTFREVAEATGESINTVAARYRYALEKLKELYG
jgi:RNA polymerase sigma-70 factor (ECF subfamily)